MQTKFAFKKLVNPLFKGVAFGFGLLLIIGIAFAFSTWAPGQPPQGNPANGNVQLASTCPSCPAGYNLNTATNTCIAVETSGRAYGYCSATTGKTCCYDSTGRTDGCGSSRTYCNASGLISPAICATNTSCGCASGYTLKPTGGSDCSNNLPGTLCNTTCTALYYTCIKN
jgi:hypothetical protein